MIIDDKKYIVYGLSPLMQQTIKNALSNLSTSSINDVLDSVSEIPTLSQSEINLILFEIGREYERKKHVRR